MASALCAAVLFASVAKSAAQATGETALFTAEQGIGPVVAASVDQSKTAQARRVADQKTAPAAAKAQAAAFACVDPAKQTRVAGAGKGLLADAYPIDAKIAKLPAYVLKISCQPTDEQKANGAASVEKASYDPARVEKADYSWRRNSWGVCRAWLTCDSGRQISCWAEGWNCDAYSNGGNNANVFCKEWDNAGNWHSSWDTCP